MPWGERRWSPATLASGDRAALWALLGSLFKRFGYDPALPGDGRVPPSHFVPRPLEAFELESSTLQGQTSSSQPTWLEATEDSSLQDAKAMAAWAMKAEERRRAAVEASSPGGHSSSAAGSSKLALGRAEAGTEGRATVAVARWSVGGGTCLAEKVREVHFWLRQSFAFDAPEPMPARLSADGSAVPLTTLHPMDDPLCNGTMLCAVLSALVARAALRQPKCIEGFRAPWRHPRTPQQAQVNLEAAMRFLQSEVRPPVCALLCSCGAFSSQRLTICKSHITRSPFPTARSIPRFLAWSRRLRFVRALQRSSSTCPPSCGEENDAPSGSFSGG